MDDLYNALIDMDDPYDLLMCLRDLKKIIKTATRLFIIVNDKIKDEERRLRRAESSNHVMKNAFIKNHSMRLHMLERSSQAIYKYQAEHLDEAWRLQMKFNEHTIGNMQIGAKITCIKYPSLSTNVLPEDTELE